jgi:pimeloyl-ACP methyl ester carboxylesterase
MTTFILIPGAGGDAWYWHLVQPELEAQGHRALAVELPSDDDAAGLAEYADVVVAAATDAGLAQAPVVLVAQSMGGFTAPLVCDRLSVQMIVMVAAMVPRAGETPGEWWTNTGHARALAEQAERTGLPTSIGDDIEAMLFNDVPADVTAAALGNGKAQSGTPFEAPWPMAAWPDVPTRFVLCRDDRLFPAPFLRRVVDERLGVVPDEIEGGHLVALGHPRALADRLVRYAADVTS